MTAKFASIRNVKNQNLGYNSSPFEIIYGTNLKLCDMFL